MNGTCYIVGAGDFYGELNKNPEDLLIAADGGYEHVLKLGLVPDILIGDFDSLDELPKDIKTLRYPVEKDETDMFLAYKIGTQKGCREFMIYGGVGGREDHTFANYSLLLYAKNQNNSAFLFGNHTKTYILKNEKILLSGHKGKTVSVFAFGGMAEGVSIKGLKYELEDGELLPDFPLGVSNSFIDETDAFISVKNGSLLIIEEF